MSADQIFFEQEMDGANNLAPLNKNGEPAGKPVGTSSKVGLDKKETVHGKEALKKIKDFNPALFKIISEAYDPKK